MRALLSALLLTCACHGTTKTAPNLGTQPLSAKDIVKSSSPAIVRVETGEGLGTGFIIDKTGLVATNLHVVRGNKEIRVKLFGGEVYPVMQIVGVDPGRDLALLRIQPRTALPVLRLGDSDAMVAGDQIVAIGNPLGLDFSVSAGLISEVRPVCTLEAVARHKKNLARFEELATKRLRTPQEDAELRELECSQELKVLQISAPISQGSSGGPLFNQAGEVVGVTTAILTAGQNINLAIPTNYLKAIVARPDAMTMDEFVSKIGDPEGEHVPAPGGNADTTPIDRQVPDHPVSLLDGCSRDQIADTVKAILEAIGTGAPLYNAGKMDQCFWIYEGTATKLEHDTACKGIKIAFGDGLKRAGTMSSFKQKAWAMRDTFDGLLNVSEKWAKANQNTAPPAAKKP